MSGRTYSRPDLILKIPERQRDALLLLCRILRDHGYESYLVGGSIRDLLMERSAGDFDIATNAHPEVVMRVFHKTVPTGIKHGTITVLLAGEKFEVTTYRAESGYSDGRHPDAVSYSDSLEEDLKRRDFTINALAYDPLRERLIDMHDGLPDIQSKIIRTIGNPHDRFFEDGLRPVRACRFASTLEFTIEEETLKALSDGEVMRRVAMIAVERFSDELRKGFAASRASRMIDLLERTGLLYLFTADLLVRRSVPDALRLVDEMPECPFPFRFAAYLNLIGCKEECASRLASELKLSNHEARDIRWGIRILIFIGNRLTATSDRDGLKTLRRFLSELKAVYGEATIPYLKSIHCCQFTSGIDSWIDCVQNVPLIVKDLEINGADIMNLGYRGREIGVLMNSLLEQVIEDPSKNVRASLLKLAQTKSSPK